MYALDKSRLGLFLVAWLVWIYALPLYYGKVAYPERFYLSGDFSPVNGRFIYRQYFGDTAAVFDQDGQSYGFDSVKYLLPFEYARDLDKWGAFPLTVKGRKLTKEQARESQVSRVSPAALSRPYRRMAVLFESAPKTASLALPGQLVVIRDNELIVWSPAGRRPLDALSRRLMDKVVSAGVTFPLQYAVSNPSLFKPFDEGILLADAKGRFFQIKRVKGQLQVRALPGHVDGPVRYMSLTEDRRRAYYGVIVTDHTLYLNTYAHGPVALPLPVKISDLEALELRSTPFNHVVTQRRAGHFLQMSAYDPQGKRLSAHAQSYPAAMTEHLHRLALGRACLTPVAFEQWHARYDDATPTITITPHWLAALAAGIVWAALFASVIVYRQRRTGQRFTRREFVRREGLCLGFIVLLGLPALLARCVSGPLRRPLDSD